MFLPISGLARDFSSQFAKWHEQRDAPRDSVIGVVAGRIRHALVAIGRGWVEGILISRRGRRVQALVDRLLRDRCHFALACLVLCSLVGRIRLWHIYASLF